MSRLRSLKFWLALILLVAAALRFYELEPYLRFLGDEGRDVLVVKRMIVEKDFTFLGPSASVGGFYIGPLYYYFMLPFLAIWNLSPVGPAVMSALFGLALVGTIFLFARYFFGDRTALVAAFLATLSPKLVEISRFSWNPNPMPLFSLLTFLFLYLASLKKRLLFSFLAGLSLGVLQELHYISLAVIPVVYLASFLTLPKDKKLILHFLLITAGLLLGNSLFIGFEIKNNFPNTRTALEFIFRGGATVAPRSPNLLSLFDDVARQLFEITFAFRGSFAQLLYRLSLLGLFFWSIRSFSTPQGRTKVTLLLCWLVLGTLGVGFYRGTLLEHYFGNLFPLPILLVALLFGELFRFKIGKPVAVFGLILLLFFSLPKLYFFQPPNNLVSQTKSVAAIVLELAGNQPYNFALITPGNSDHAYRYFLEIAGRPPVTILNPQLDPDRKSVTDHLIIVCEDPKCNPYGHSLWEVAGFGQGEIIEERPGPAGIRILKLIHYKGPTND